MPSRSRPTSASSTAASTCIRVRSCAIVKSVGAWRLAATVWPESMVRETTTPSTGARISVCTRSSRVCSSAACFWRTVASAAFCWASATWSWAWTEATWALAARAWDSPAVSWACAERRAAWPARSCARAASSWARAVSKVSLGLVALALRDEVPLREVDPALELQAAHWRRSRSPGPRWPARWRSPPGRSRRRPASARRWPRPSRRRRARSRRPPAPSRRWRRWLSTCACALSRSARAAFSLAWKTSGSIRAISWPRRTGELKSTRTSRIWPETWLPTWTVVTAARAPVAETLATIVPRSTIAVRNRVAGRWFVE